MPSKQEKWQCSICGKGFELEGHAKVCEANHVERERLHITSLRPLPGTSFCYLEGSEMPAILEVSDKFGKHGTYVLQQDNTGQTNWTQPLRKNRRISLRP